MVLPISKSEAGEDVPLLLAEPARSLRKKWKAPRARAAQLQAVTAIERVLQTEGLPSNALHEFDEIHGDFVKRRA